MAEDEEGSKVKHSLSDSNSNHRHPTLPFVEVICKSSGKTRRFAAGTEAGFAVNLINTKLGGEGPFALHIEAVKQGEEPITFGPNSLLVHYGHAWKLQTVTQLKGLTHATKHDSHAPHFDDSFSKEGISHPQPVFSLLYFGKIFLAFILIFVLGAIFTLALENLPALILYINTSV